MTRWRGNSTAPSRARSVGRKKPAKKATSKRKAAASRGAKRTRKKVVKKLPARSAKKKTRATRAASLGRPRLPADAQLDLVFQKDYQAREIFGFLGVHTIRELEAFPPGEIIEKLTSPVVQTVERIRKTLALSNRCLANDKRFALDFQARLKRGG